MSLYQKYRAKSFSEVLTQNHVTQILQASLKKSNFGHSYLFVGTRGAGKTSLARIFARALNCLDKDFVAKNGEPCNKCESCLLSLSGNHPDILEMDAASNRGIDEIRNLKESVEFMPSIGQYKVYIIDEVHMMTKEAFNALLKTLEEPPKHVVFLMATTELYKIPTTIISRSQVFELKFASIEDILKKIQLILKSEKKEIDLEGQKLIAKLGKGSFRDTETILEKVLNSSDSKQISLEEVTSILGMSQAVLVSDIKDLIYAKDLLGLQKNLQDNLDDGIIQNFNYQLADEVYTDIVASLESGKAEPFNFELFNFLTSVEKEIRSTSSPKMLYIAKILNFVKEFAGYKFQVSSLRNDDVIASEAKQSESSVHIASKNQILNKSSSSTQTFQDDKTNEIPVLTTSNRDDIEEKPQEIINPNNPASMMRARSAKKTSGEGSEIPVFSSKNRDDNSSSDLRDSDSKDDTKRISTISKMDFLEYLKSKNMFLYRFFVHKDFEINSGNIIIDVEKKMEQDLLRKSTTQKLISDFAAEVGTELKIQIGEPKLDRRKTEEKEIDKVSKKVEDLSEGEIKEIFGYKR